MRVPQIFNYETEEYVDLPWKWEICSACNGHGKSSAYLGAFTHDEMYEDPDFADDYFAGNYDRTCDCCEGGGKVMAVDFDRLTPEETEAFCQEERDRAEDRAIEAAERRMGC